MEEWNLGDRTGNPLVVSDQMEDLGDRRKDLGDQREDLGELGRAKNIFTKNIFVRNIFTNNIFLKI